jgi:hypothetical protein
MNDNLDSFFTLKVGEVCIIKSTILQDLNSTRYKMFYVRVSNELLIWVDNNGQKGSYDYTRGFDFSDFYWEKL